MAITAYPQTKEVSFLEDTLLAAEVNGKVYVAVGAIASGLGFTKGQYDRQVKNIKADLVLSQGASDLTLPTKGGLQEVTVIDIEFLPIWLAKISITPKMKAENPILVNKLVDYQLKAKDVLYRAFFPVAQQLSFEDVMIAQLQEQKKMKEQLAAQQAYIENYGKRLEDNENKVTVMLEHLTKTPERANIRHAINEYCRVHNATQDHAWSELVVRVRDKFGIDLAKRVDNKRKAIQTKRIQDGKKGYADSTLKSKYTTVDAIFENDLQKEVMGILAGLLG